MLSRRWQFALVPAAAGLLWLPARTWAQDPQIQGRATVKAPPEPSAALAEIAPGQVVVTYEDGQLTIEAKNAQLIDVLRAVCTRIGAELDAPPEASEPILITLGPAPARVVLTALLDGSQFHYAMKGAADDPNVLASVIVFPKTKDSKTLRPVAQDSVSQRQVNSATATSIGSEPDTKQLMRELITQAQAELANSGGIVFDGHGGDENASDAEPASTVPQPNVATVLKLVEAQISALGDAAATDANSPQMGQGLGALTSQNPVVIPRHRRH